MNYAGFAQGQHSLKYRMLLKPSVLLKSNVFSELKHFIKDKQYSEAKPLS